MHKINFSLRMLAAIFAVAVLLQLTTSCAQTQVRQDVNVSRSTEKPKILVPSWQNAKMLPSDEKPKIFVQLGQTSVVTSVVMSSDGGFALS